MKRGTLQLEDIACASTAELRGMWEAATGQQPPRVPVSVLRQLIGYQLQEAKSGRLKAITRRKLEQLARSLGKEHSTKAASVNVSPGTRLVREWNGRTILVEVLEDGFRFDNRNWKSLSQIARHVTGAHWSGPRFFGLSKRG